MTSQVAVANLHGIAVASDTVVSQSSSEGMKTLENMSKIYTLGKNHKVVLVHSGNADINGVSHWLHLTEWIAQIKEPYSTLAEYVDSYLAWSNQTKPLHTETSEMDLIHRLLNDHYYFIKNRADETLELEVENLSQGETLSEVKIADVIYQYSLEGLKYLESLTDYGIFTLEQAEGILSSNSFDVVEKLEYIFKDFDLNKELREVLLKSAPLVLLKHQEMNFVDSEIGFVGFGTDEPFGGIIHLHCRGYYGGKLHVFVEEKFGVAPVGIERGSQSIIRHFAQGDAIWAFIRGYNPRILSRALGAVREKIEEYFGEKEWEFTDDSGEAKTKLTSELAYELADEVYLEIRDKYSIENFSSPLLNSIESMSTISLAAFAESLVGIQALSTYSQRGTATVGGLIEVVTIDRAEGVVWRQKIGSTK